MIKIPGYKITEKLNECSGFTLYRGYEELCLKNTNTKPVKVSDKAFLFKYLKLTGPDLIGISLLKLEYQKLANIKSDVIESVYGIKELGNGVVMIVDDVDAINLKDFNKRSSFHLETFLKIAIQLAKSLAEIHKHDIVHKDIRPCNIMVNKENGTARLCNFGIGYLKKDSLNDKDFLLERLPYLSPEQSERINRLVDHRTDFYSLGITFYEMLTGTVPFSESDPAELIHAHIAKLPVSPYELDSKPRPVNLWVELVINQP